MVNSAIKPTDWMEEWLEYTSWITGGNELFNIFSFTNEELLLIDPRIRRRYYYNTPAAVNLIAENNRRYNDLISVQSVINEILVTRNKGKKYGQIRNYDYTQKPNIDKEQFEAEYPNDYKIKFFVHNIPLDVVVGFTSTSKAFNEQSYFSQQLSPQLDQLIKLQKTLIANPLADPAASTQDTAINQKSETPGPATPKVRKSENLDSLLIDTTCCRGAGQNQTVGIISTLVDSIYEQILIFDRRIKMYNGFLPMMTLDSNFNPLHPNCLICLSGDPGDGSATAEIIFPLTLNTLATGFIAL